jgi:hypothetical protein
VIFITIYDLQHDTYRVLDGLGGIHLQFLLGDDVFLA